LSTALADLDRAVELFDAREAWPSLVYAARSRRGSCHQSPV